MNLEQVIEYLFSSGYLTNVNNTLRLTTKFFTDAKGLGKNKKQQGVYKVEDRVLAKVVDSPTVFTYSKELSVHYTTQDWKALYLNLIQICDVPAKIETRNGPYAANQYAESGMKKFIQAIKGELISFIELVWCVKYYYSSDIQMKKSITKYMEEDCWQSDVQVYRKKVALKGADSTFKELTVKKNQDGRYTSL